MSSPDATQGKNVQQKQEKSKNEWLLQDHSRVVGKPEVIRDFQHFVARSRNVSVLSEARPHQQGGEEHSVAARVR
jgi:hypothetical protein